MSQSDAAEPPSSLRVGVVILAAGQGARMRSHVPKVLHPVAGRPMVEHVLDVARRLHPAATVVVISPNTPRVRQALAQAAVVEQAEQLGTGHAVLQARKALDGRAEQVLVLYGDTPLVRLETAQRLLRQLEHATVAILTADLADPCGYGRVVRDGRDGAVSRVVEEAEANPEILQLNEINSGLMAFRADWLWQRLPELEARSNSEYYLTDLVELALREGRDVSALKTDQSTEALGINSQAQLADANRVAWDRATERLMQAGVTVLDRATTYVEQDVEVGVGSVIHPNTHLQGATRIGSDCQVGPNTIVVSSVIGDGCRVWSSVVEHSEIEANVHIGPFSHVRPGCYVEREAQLGNSTETKASRIGRGTQMHHFCYIGDAEVGEHVNVGAGTVTCNFDGRDKHRTVIGDNAFIGSDSMLVAPVRIGARARTGAGSVVTRDVPDDATVAGVPARTLSSSRASSGEPANSEEGD
jgi:bifunctional UDP-N-acetylglucosamine pyrophosphorylase/glucosamine-1-phosphate N-acetyltransferase